MQAKKTIESDIKEIADLLEFPNISFFGKYCRTHFGASPTDLRKQFREQSNDERVQSYDIKNEA